MLYIILVISTINGPVAAVGPYDLIASCLEDQKTFMEPFKADKNISALCMPIMKPGRP